MRRWVGDEQGVWRGGVAATDALGPSEVAFKTRLGSKRPFNT